MHAHTCQGRRNDSGTPLRPLGAAAATTGCLIASLLSATTIAHTRTYTHIDTANASLLPAHKRFGPYWPTKYNTHSDIIIARLHTWSTLTTHNTHTHTPRCSLQVWDLAKCAAGAEGGLKLTLTGHINAIRGLAVSPRHPYLFSGGEDKKVMCWDLETNKVSRHKHDSHLIRQ